MTVLQASQTHPEYGQLFLSIRRLEVLMHALSDDEKSRLSELNEQELNWRQKLGVL
jgi:hypothetical protein